VIKAIKIEHVNWPLWGLFAFLGRRQWVQSTAFAAAGAGRQTGVLKDLKKVNLLMIAYTLFNDTVCNMRHSIRGY
jgi:hypothetical protein